MPEMDTATIENQFAKFLIYTCINSSKPKCVLKTVNLNDIKVPRIHHLVCSRNVLECQRTQRRI